LILNKFLVGNQFNLSYHGRIQRAAPAEGDGEIHKLVQNQIIPSVIDSANSGTFTSGIIFPPSYFSMLLSII
jgi:hypothetical protein